MTDHLHPSFPVVLAGAEAAWLQGVAKALEQAGINHLRQCSDNRQVLALLDADEGGVILLGPLHPPPSGEKLLNRIVKDFPKVAVIVVSHEQQVDAAVRCMRAGATDYYVRTDGDGPLVAGMLRAIRSLELNRRRVPDDPPPDQLEYPEAFAGIITANRAMRRIFHYVEAVAHSLQPVLICGESGTGKELVAQALHRVSQGDRPWVPVNVAGLDDDLFADTIFGHIRGAFTGADQPRRGMVEQAIGGTLFLDEIGDLSQASQMKLLRLVQDGEYCPLGSEICHRAKTRIVVATNQELAAKVAAGSFRQDLYYRLKAHYLELPPLRHRPEDIPLLLDHFLTEAAAELGHVRPTASLKLVQLLTDYPFPGNVREFRSMVYDAVSLHRSGNLSLETFKRAMGLGKNGMQGKGLAGANELDAPLLSFNRRLPTFKEALQLLVEEAMRRSGGNQTHAARLLGISRPALSKRLKKLAGEPPEP